MPFGKKGSEEYRKLMLALEEAENRRDKFEVELDNITKIKDELENDLDNLNDEIDRLLDIKDSMTSLDPEDAAGCNLFLKGFGSSTTERDLVEYFERYGRIVSVRIFRSQNNSVPLYGFLEYEESYMAERALDHRPHYVRGHKLFVQQAEHERKHKNRVKPY